MNSSLIASWQVFSKELFNSFGEENLEEREGVYKNLDPRALYTTVEDFQSIFESGHVMGDWVDLGSGSGLSVLMFAQSFPGKKSYGIELTDFRHEKGLSLRKKLKLSNAHLIHDDLFHCSLPAGNTFFLYFPTGIVLDRVLSELKNLPSFERLIVIESHGDLLPRLFREKWLRPIAEITLTSPRYYPNAVVFERQASAPDVGPHDLSFKEKILYIEEGKDIWLGDSFGLEWQSEDNYVLLNPPRTIQWSQVKNVCDEKDLSPRERFLCQLRRRGPLTLSHERGQFHGHLRKIRVSPSFALELSSGEWVEWEKITRISLGEFLCYDSSLGSFFLPPVQQ